MPGNSDKPEAHCSRLKLRREFLLARRLGHKWVRPGMVVQARQHQKQLDGGLHSSSVRLGFTVSKKVGNSVRRNRVKRRLRAVAEQVFPKQVRPGFDIVIIGRAATATRPFKSLVNDLNQALKKLKVFRDVPLSKD